MGGELSLRSQPGQGSTFTVRLYLPRIAADPKNPLPSASALRSVTGYKGPRRTLLVVDDQPLHRQLLAGLLMPLGFTVLEAASGQECLEVVEQRMPDLLLLDITMDGLDGWQTARLVRERLTAEQLPIVFVSANLFDNQPEQLQALGCQGFVAKPVLESELLDTLQGTLKLDWIRDPADGPVPPAPAMVPHEPQPLPAQLREDLLRLARQGQAVALRQRLWAARTELPALAATLTLLQSYADRFDFQTLMDHLRSTAETPDEPSTF